MSLIDARPERKEVSGGPTRPPRLWKLVAMLAAVLYLIWFLGRYA